MNENALEGGAPCDRVLAETDGTGPAGTKREYIWLSDMPVAVIDKSVTPNQTYMVHADHLNRPYFMTDAARAIVWKAIYEPFGAVYSTTGTAAQTYRFPGQWFQIETNLAYNWHRHYDATLGRYVSADPLGLYDGPSVYGYVGQAPLERVDPTGLAGPAVIPIAVGVSACARFPAACAAAIATATRQAIELCGDVYEMAKKSKSSGKEKANDIPSWAEGQKPKSGESGKEFADRLLNDKYGPGKYKTGPDSEHNNLKKYGDRR